MRHKTIYTFSMPLLFGIIANAQNGYQSAKEKVKIGGKQIVVKSSVYLNLMPQVSGDNPTEKLDRENRQIMKTNGEDAYLFQAAPNQRWFGENKPLSTRHVWHLVKRFSKLSGIGDVSPHDLRRTAITQAFKQRVPIRHIQRMSGHQDLNTLRLYDLDRENLEDNAINELTYDS